ncbi:MAG TPA: potassium-transporting ATPase subunit C [Pseudonocardiaceae bacterium]|jgi:K+-transporting ATPase ATPase C chain|nr:potassium-transporting ATPase subunit C [Pseudonocardiaceae bacterium]
MKFSGLLRQSWAGLKVLLVLTVITGIVYPAAVWAVSRVPGLDGRAEGSVVIVAGQAVGSSLIGLNPIDPNAGRTITANGVTYADDRYFHTRPSAEASDFSATDPAKLGLGANDGSASAASNLAQNSDVLDQQVAARRAVIAKRDGVSQSQVPADAVTASGSGLDPGISVAYADEQAARVAAVNGLSVAQVDQLISANTDGRGLGVLGEPAVNVQTLNLAVRAEAHPK